MSRDSERSANEPRAAEPEPRRLGRRLALASAVALGTLALVELGARLWLGESFRAGIVSDVPMGSCVRFDPQLGWANVSKLHARLVGPTFEYPVFEYELRTNSAGLRDVEIAVEKSPGVVRILSLGDSLAWGWGVSNGEAYADVLERALGGEVELINAGVPGYSTDQQLLQLLELGPRYRPDIVLLAFVANDVEGNLADHNYGYGKPRYERAADGRWRFANQPVANSSEDVRRASIPQWKRVFSHSAVWALLRGTPPRMRDEHGGELPLEELRRAFRTHREELYDANAMAALTAHMLDPQSPTHALLERVRARCAELGARLLVFGIPLRHDEHLYMPDVPLPRAALEALRDGAPYKSELTLALEELGARLGFLVASVDHALLLRTRAGENFNVGDGHLDAAGHAVVAGALEPALRALAIDVRAARRD